jgi:type I restriction enzyme M protein
MNQQKHLGQYFTPPAIAGVMVELVKPFLPLSPLVMDLSCGEGILLSKVLEQGVTTPDRVWGLDIDPQMQAIWAENDVLGDSHLLVQDGLAFELDTVGLDSPGVDLAIGNPPFNRAQNLITDPDVLKNFQLGRRPLAPAQESLVEIGQLGFEFADQGSTFLVRIFDQVQTVVSQPVEALFLEKFVQITRPGGYIVIILPEGLLSNEGSQDVRTFMAEQTDVRAIIGLPRRVFDNDAKTSIVLLRRKHRPGDPQLEKVFLATISRAVRDGKAADLKKAIDFFHGINAEQTETRGV